MERKELETTLTRLHEELAEAGSVDPELRAQLETLVTDIRGVLDGAGEAPDAESDSLTERARESIDRFEVSHPKLTVALGRVLDALSNMGI